MALYLYNIKEGFEYKAGHTRQEIQVRILGEVPKPQRSWELFVQGEGRVGAGEEPGRSVILLDFTQPSDPSCDYLVAWFKSYNPQIWGEKSNAEVVFQATSGATCESGLILIARFTADGQRLVVREPAYKNRGPPRYTIFSREGGRIICSTDEVKAGLVEIKWL